MAACADRPLNRTQPGPPGRPTPRAWGPVAVDGLSLSRADFRRAESPSGSDPPAPWTITLIARERAAANATPAPQHPVGDRSRNPSVPRARKGSARAASSPMRGCKPNPSSHGAWRSSPQLHRRRNRLWRGPTQSGQPFADAWNDGRIDRANDFNQCVMLEASRREFRSMPDPRGTRHRTAPGAGGAGGAGPGGGRNTENPGSSLSAL
jgi:hypothetical protein